LEFNLNKDQLKNIILLVIATFVLVAIDQATKCYVVRNIKASDPIVIFDNFFEFTYTLNPGVAFGFLAEGDSSWRHPFFITVTIMAIVFIAYTFLTLKEDHNLMRFSLCLILSGALGNFVDRLRLKAVIDFISVHFYDHYWPAFNIADALITIGVALMAIDLIVHHKKAGEEKCDR